MSARTYLRTEDAAQYLCVKKPTLEHWRVEGIGPKYRKHGGVVVYASDDLDAWSDAQVKGSTTDEEEGAGQAATA